MRQSVVVEPGPLRVSLPGAGRLATAGLSAEVVVVEAEVVTGRRSRKGIAAAVRRRWAALWRKTTATVGGSRLETAGGCVNGGCYKRGRQWGQRDRRGDGGRRWAGGLV